jgi:hypothetical protein
MTELKIVELIEKNPIMSLSGSYQHRLLTRIKENFNEDEQQMFVANFYCYLNYNSKKDLVINLDSVWQWLGFSQKIRAKNLLERYFIKDKDYKILLAHTGEQKAHSRGGHNKEIIMMTVNTFKKLCIKADTKRADQIHEYYIKLEGVLQDVLNEESSELRLQLENKNNESIKEKELLREQTILEHFPDNTQCVYYGMIDDKHNEESLIKFGNSNFLRQRVESHKRTFDNFRLINAFKVENKTQIENGIKYHPILTKLRRTIVLKNIRQTELLTLNGMNFDELDKIIKDVISNIEYSPENYTRLLEENNRMKKEIMVLRDKIIELKDNNKLQNSFTQLTTGHECPPTIVPKCMTNNEKYVSSETDVEEELYENEIQSFLPLNRKRVKKFKRNSDGNYHIEGVIYNELNGTREEVWNGEAYRTEGLLTKDDLTVNTKGVVVSKKKYITAKKENRIKNKYQK